jgi:hypothetical protein
MLALDLGHALSPFPNKLIDLYPLRGGSSLNFADEA